jgi:hypothetical protein
VHRALKYTLVSLFAIVVVLVACLYGLYLAGARHISPDWKPTAAQYPEAARMALWRSYGGRGAPEGDPMSPAEFAWRWYRAGSAVMDGKPVDPRMTMAGRVARTAGFMGQRSAGRYHLMEMSAAIRASRWSVASQLDTVLDAAYFGGDAHGMREGAMRVYGQPLERLDEARVHVLVALMHAPNALDPWCHADRLRERVFATARKWNVPASAQQLEAALAAIGAKPADDCSGPRE